MGVFNVVTLLKFYNLTKNAFPGCEKLPAGVQGGVVSLVFNRGTSRGGDRREMRAILDLLPKKDVRGIAE